MPTAALAAGLATVAVVLAHVLLGTAGDVPVHLYRASLVEHGVLVWDGFWYGGFYPFASYSLGYYFLAVVLGHAIVTSAACIASAGLFGSIAVRAWGPAGRWPAYVFALFAPAPCVFGQWPYALGLAMLLGALCAVQSGRTWMTLLFAGLTLAASPLAFSFLLLALAAMFAARPVTRKVVVLGGGLAVVAGFGLVLDAGFGGGIQDFSGPDLARLLLLCVLGAALGLVWGWDFIPAFFVLWAAAGIIAFLVDNSVGHNVTRLRFLIVPLVLAAVIRTRFRPWLLAGPALIAAFVYAAVPYASVVRDATNVPDHGEAAWAPALVFLRAQPVGEFRVEVVPTAAHWEAWYFPQAGFPLARGWHRAPDLAQNGVLYKKTVTPSAYEAWLRTYAVRYVVLSPFRLDFEGAEAEAQLLRSGRSGLTLLYERDGWRIYELPDATPLLTGPATSRITRFTHDDIDGWTAGTGQFQLRVNYTPQWIVRQGDVCLVKARDGMTVVVVQRGGLFQLAIGSTSGIFDRWRHPPAKC